MYNKFNLYLSSRYLPRWVVFGLDLFIVIFSFVLSNYLRFNFDTEAMNMGRVTEQLLILIPAAIVGFLVFKPFNGIIRHTATRDIQHILYSLLLSFGLLTILTLLTRDMGYASQLMIPFFVCSASAINASERAFFSGCRSSKQ